MKYLTNEPISFGGFDGETWERVFGGEEKSKKESEEGGQEKCQVKTQITQTDC